MVVVHKFDRVVVENGDDQAGDLRVGRVWKYTTGYKLEATRPVHVKEHCHVTLEDDSTLHRRGLRDDYRVSRPNRPFAVPLTGTSIASRITSQIGQPRFGMSRLNIKSRRLFVFKLF